MKYANLGFLSRLHNLLILLLIVATSVALTGCGKKSNNDDKGTGISYIECRMQIADQPGTEQEKIDFCNMMSGNP